MTESEGSVSGAAAGGAPSRGRPLLALALPVAAVVAGFLFLAPFGDDTSPPGPDVTSDLAPLTTGPQTWVLASTVVTPGPHVVTAEETNGDTSTDVPPSDDLTAATTAAGQPGSQLIRVPAVSLNPDLQPTVTGPQTVSPSTTEPGPSTAVPTDTIPCQPLPARRLAVRIAERLGDELGSTAGEPLNGRGCTG